jgi:predicted dehydrogenase
VDVIGVGIVGCGRMGAKRAGALKDARLVAAADLDPARARQLAAEVPGCEAVPDWTALVGRRDVDAVIVSTTHDALARVALEALAQGKHVFLEKPGARSAEELRRVGERARAAGRVARVGFNHRFHPALRRMRAIVDAGELGPLFYVRARYGHGGRPGYEREWRADRALSGGGELLDQGVHLVDLARWFLGDFTDVQGHLGTFFWDMPVEDNAFLLLRTASRRTAFLHASWTEWRNLFSFELFGRDGKLQTDGLGGSYGVERLTHYRMRPEMGPPDTTSWEYPGGDGSWSLEWSAFLDCLRGGDGPVATVEDALAALDVVGRMYASAEREP